jgi:thiosulfate dehydrogenase
MSRMMGGLVLGVLLGVVLTPLAVLGWFRLGNMPVAVADKTLPLEDKLEKISLDARVAKEQPKIVPVAADETALNGGAQVYRDHCAACHGVYGKPVGFAVHMSPQAPQLWLPRVDGKGVGVSGVSATEIYWKVSNGIRQSGMPAYKDTLSSNEVWQVSLLLTNADKPLPPAALEIVHPQGAPEPGK